MDEDKELNSPAAKRSCNMNEPEILDINRSVTISNLPVHFMELTFKSFLEKLRLKFNIGEETPRSIVRVMHFRSDCKAIVEFSSERIASDMAKIPPDHLIFYKHELSIEYSLYTHDTQMLENVFDQTSVLNNLQDSVFDQSRFVGNLKASTPTEKVAQLMKDMSPYREVQPKARRKLTDSAYNQGNDEEDVTELAHDVDQDIEVLPVHQLEEAPQPLADTVPFQEHVHQFRHPEQQVIPRQKAYVLVSDLPEAFDKNYLQYTINSLLWEAQCYPIGENCIVTTESIDNGSLKCELINSMCLDHLCLVATCDFMGASIKFKPESKTADCMKSCSTLVSGLPKAFDEKYLRYTLNTLLWEAQCSPFGENCILSINNLDIGCVKCELINSMSADHLCLLGSCDFMGASIRFKPESETADCTKSTSTLVSDSLDTIDEDLTFTSESSTTKVCVTGLPVNYDKEYLRFVLEKFLLESGNVDSNKSFSAILQCEQTGTTTAVVEFHSVVHARAVTEKGQFPFGNGLVKVSSATSVPPHKKAVELKSKEGDIIFLQKMVLIRRLFACRNHSSAYARLLAEVSGEGISCTIQDLAKRRKHFSDQFRAKVNRGESNLVYWDALSVIFDNKPIDILKDTAFFCEDKVSLIGSGSNAAMATIGLWPRRHIKRISLSLSLQCCHVYRRCCVQHCII